MSKYNSLFEKGYYIADFEDLSINIEEFKKICNEVYSFMDNKEKYFEYFSIVDKDMPHRIPYVEREERLKYIKENQKKTI